MFSKLHVCVFSFINDQKLYVERLERAKRGDPIEDIKRDPIISGSIEHFQQRGQDITTQLCRRVEWFLELQHKSKKQFDAEFALKIITTDRVWVNDANVFMKELEAKVKDVLEKNANTFEVFRTYALHT